MNLTISLYGQEYVYFEKKHKRENGQTSETTKHIGTNLIINEINVADRFVDGPPPPGKWTFPFELAIPAWLPASFCYAGEDNSCMSVDYSLVAQFTPKSNTDWADADKRISIFRGTSWVWVTHARIQSIPKPMTENLKTEAGGFLCIGKTECNTQIVL